MLAVGTCETCAKQSYKSRKDARRAAKDRNPEEQMTAYVCPINEHYWHIGHLPYGVLRGQSPRSGIIPAHERGPTELEDN